MDSEMVLGIFVTTLVGLGFGFIFGVIRAAVEREACYVLRHALGNMVAFPVVAGIIALIFGGIEQAGVEPSPGVGVVALLVGIIAIISMNIFFWIRGRME